MLFTPQEIQATLGLLNRTPMSPAEALFAQGFFQRLVAFCQPQTMPASKEGAAASKEEKNEENTSTSATDPS